MWAAKGSGIGRENGSDGLAAHIEPKGIGLPGALAEALGPPGS
jgi:hypothetical protein